MPAKFSLFAVAALPIIPIALACGGDDEGGGITVPDAAVNNTPDAPAVVCKASTSYAPTFGSGTQFAETSGSGFTGQTAHFIRYRGVLNGDMAPDLMQLELYAGFAAFAGRDIAPGTYQITGAEAQYSSCGVCVRMFTDLMQGGMGTADQYFATGGTVTLTSVNGNLVGTVSNVTMTHVTINDQFVSTPLNDGCNSTITTASMSAPLMMGSAMGPVAPMPQLDLSNRKF